MKAIIIGEHLLFAQAKEMAEKLLELENIGVQVVVLNESFEPEPIRLPIVPLPLPSLCEMEIKIKDFPRNKYFDKPRNNFKK
jgi:hypothetical protein